ncbi:DUF5753 domain-containing protein [Micromonospora sp. DH13]|uniref:DUF5753 domain-containing protein n=1 Tax=Micromonospora sp. DH13 TaxID=2857013 RepID=UPI0018E99F46|nr:DUF5753 domain-containing protein [Micromonospora sp. DH13]MDI5936907.1 DUF5753 domain-containing protein [Micromonospora sp. DH15]
MRVEGPPAPKYLELFDEALDTGGLFGRMLAELVTLDKAQVWLRGWRVILGQARALRWFDPLHVPGLFQTEAYARAVFEADDLLDAEEVQRRLDDRMESQAVLYGDCQPLVVAVVDESVLRRRVGSRKIMCDQASHLAWLATEHPGVRVHVVPCTAEENPGLNGPFILATLSDDVELAFLGGQIGGQELDKPEDLRRLQRTWEATLGAALPPQESIDRLREVAESWS